MINKMRLQFSEAEIDKVLNNPRYLWLLAIVLELVYLFPLLFLGENARVTVYDNLDIVIPLNKMLVDSGMMFASSETIVPNMMGGLPRFLYGSELNVYSWLFLFFKPFTAYLINEILMHVVALLSMLVLLKRHFVPNDIENRNIVIFSVAIMFSLVPFYTGAGLSVPALPLALYAFLNIRSGDTGWKNWLIITAIPFYSSLVLVYFFFLLVMTGLFIVDFIRERHFQWPFFLALGVMSVIFLIVEHHLVYATFFAKDFVSHRVEFDYVQNLSLFEVQRRAHQLFLLGLKNMDWRTSAYVVPFTFYIVLLSFYKKRLNQLWSLAAIALFVLLIQFPYKIQYITGGKYTLLVIALIALWAVWKRPKQRLFYGLMLLLLFFSYWYAFWFYEGVNGLAEFIPFVKQFNFSRVAYLVPVVWFLIVAAGAVIAEKKIHYVSLLMLILLGYQTTISIKMRKFSFPTDALSFKSYFAEHLFEKIDKFIGKPKQDYRVGSLTIEPAISIYNGFYTIDGYIPNYPLEYKKRFFKIIEQSLAKGDKHDRDLFRKWGSKCYLLDGGIMPLAYKKNDIVQFLRMDYQAFYDLGGRYLISSHEINASLLGNGLTFLKHFDDNETYWNIYLYRVDRPGKGK